MENSKRIEEFLAFLRDAEQEYRMAEADEQEANAETQDLLHSLELEEHTYNEYAKLSKEMKEIRKKRRAAKNKMAECLPVLEWVEQNRAVMKSIERLLGDVRKAEKFTSGPRIYTPRTKKGAKCDA